MVSHAVWSKRGETQWVAAFTPKVLIAAITGLAICFRAGSRRSVAFFDKLKCDGPSESLSPRPAARDMTASETKRYEKS